MNKTIRLSVITAVLLGGLGGCADLNIEIQQTSRVNSEATRNPSTVNSDIQGSKRTQGKNPVGVNAEATLASDTSKTIKMGSDVSGPEK